MNELLVLDIQPIQKLAALVDDFSEKGMALLSPAPRLGDISSKGRG